MREIEKQIPFIRGVTVSGGECTLHRDFLLALARLVRARGLGFLLDSNGKKTRFLTQVKLELKLANLEVVHSRVEAFRPESPFDGIVSRAFSSLEDFANWTRHLGVQETRWLAMKGVHPNEELAALPEDFRVEAEHALAVPGCQGQRHLLILRRTA